jgi:hypothetical protein
MMSEEDKKVTKSFFANGMKTVLKFVLAYAFKEFVSSLLNSKSKD